MSTDLDPVPLIFDTEHMNDIAATAGFSELDRHRLRVQIRNLAWQVQKRTIRACAKVCDEVGDSRGAKVLREQLR